MVYLKKQVFLLLIFNCMGSLYSQEIEGDWYGTLEAMKLNLVFHIEKKQNEYKATLDSPDQGGFDIPVDTVKFGDATIELVISVLNANFKGTLKDGYISGDFSQNDFKIPLKLTKDKSEITGNKKPQEPIRPFPYIEEEIRFKNGDVTLSGTLTRPNKNDKYPVVVLISGSGAQDRDESLLGHKPFLVLSDYLTRKGLAVLRYDDRGFGKSTGDFSKATTVEFSEDIESAVTFLKSRSDIDPEHIGLIGHSEGGLIASLVAAKDRNIDFIILMAGPGIPGDSLLLLQQQRIGKSMGMTNDALELTQKINRNAFDIVTKNTEEVKPKLRTYFKKTLDSIPAEKLPPGFTKDEVFISNLVNTLTSPWMRYFLSDDPAKALVKVRCPVFAINGSKDLQVPAKENLTAIEKALQKGDNKNITLKEFTGLNHLFQESETGLPAEYARIEQTIAPVVMEEIHLWISKQIQ